MKKLSLICFAIFIVLLLFIVKIAFSADIDVGSTAISRGTYLGYVVRTYIAKENPANDSGKINHIEIYMDGAGTVDVASFYEGDANTFSTRGSSGILAVDVGLNTFDAPTDFTAFDITEGDYIGVVMGDTDTAIDCDEIGGSGVWYADGDEIPCTDTAFEWYYTTETISLYATGTSEAPPPTAKPVQSQILILE